MGDAALTRPDQTRPDQAGFLGSSHIPPLVQETYDRPSLFTLASYNSKLHSISPLHFVLHQDQDQDQARPRPRPSSTGLHPANPHPSPQSSLPTPTSGGGGGGW
ncbi:uncharacterized protein RAG0_03684 [Rhynchosporium agropyri]|uniref:Uncharacterized protein n=1 Tax=Rhynchosporium agropyri TaxID=914238 RepID=A0A1E1K5G4_9HELO|nr:uncharacterized protein RAG0_03684 [Rhynchosporium agropyri]